MKNPSNYAIKVFISAFFCLIFGQFFAQSISTIDDEIYLVNSMDSNKRTLLKEMGTMELYYEYDFADSNIESRSTTLQGKLDHFSDTTLNFNTWHENSYLIYLSGHESEINTIYNSDHSVQLPINQIEYLQYNSPSRDFFRSFGTTLASLASTTILFVAPLVSINFKNGSFNKNRYYAVAGYSLISLGVSIPMIALTKPKKYYLLEKDADPERGYWYLESTIQK